MRGVVRSKRGREKKKKALLRIDRGKRAILAILKALVTEDCSKRRSFFRLSEQHPGKDVRQGS